MTVEDVGDVTVRVFEFESQQGIRLPLIMAHRKDLEKPSLLVLNVLDEDHWNTMLASYGHSFASVQKLAAGSLPAEDKQAWTNEQKMFQNNDWAMVYFPPRGIGPTAWNPAPFKQNQHQRGYTSPHMFEHQQPQNSLSMLNAGLYNSTMMQHSRTITPLQVDCDYERSFARRLQRISIEAGYV